MIRRSVLVATIFAGATVVPCQARQVDQAWVVQGTIGAVSDYRYRGLSLSGEDPAVQGGITLAHRSGVYGDVYLSTIEEYGLDENGDGSEVEATLTAGWSGEAAGYLFDVAIAAYRYPGGSDVDYVEVPVSAQRSVGPVTLSAGFAFAPEQDALGDEDNRYVWTGLDFEPDGWPVSLTARLGHEDGAYAPDGKTDWSLGLVYPVGPVALGLDWVDSDADHGTAVASVFADF